MTSAATTLFHAALSVIFEERDSIVDGVTIGDIAKDPAAHVDVVWALGCDMFGYDSSKEPNWRDLYSFIRAGAPALPSDESNEEILVMTILRQRVRKHRKIGHVRSGFATSVDAKP